MAVQCLTGRWQYDTSTVLQYSSTACTTVACAGRQQSLTARVAKHCAGMQQNATAATLAFYQQVRKA
jgi:hypothetical protein